MADNHEILHEMGQHFKDIAQWAIDAPDDDVEAFVKELAKLTQQLQISQIVREGMNGR